MERDQVTAQQGHNWGTSWLSHGWVSVLPMQGVQGFIPGGGTKIPHAAWPRKEKKIEEMG